MRYAMASLVLLAAGCSGNPQEAVRAGIKQVASGLQDQAEKPLGPIPEATPIPQDDAKVAARQRERLEWHLRTSLGAYDKVGNKDPRWDDLARKAIDRVVRRNDQPGSKLTTAEVNQAAMAAIDAGCDDPLVTIVHARTLNVPDIKGKQDLIRLRRAATRAYAASGYPAFRRAGSLESFAGELLAAGSPDDEAKKEIEATLDASLAVLAEGARSEERNGFWADNCHNTVIRIIEKYRKLGIAAEAAYERADAKMANIPELEEPRLMVRGTFWLFYGWEARTDAFAPFVPADGFRLLDERLTIARTAFEKAWKLRPEDAYAAVHMIDIDKAIGGDRATMELWFDRAMRADGDDRDACWSKLDWLDPKWHGTAEEMLAFGRACRDTKNARAGITLLVADAHWRYTGRPGVDQLKHMRQPEVWADIKSVYEEYLKIHPIDWVARNKFAMFCHLSGHYREAEVQYVALGDRLAQWTEAPWAPLFQLKKNRERNARLVLGKEGRLTFPGWHFVAYSGDDGEWHVNIPVSAPHTEQPGILGADVSHVWNCSSDGITYGIRVVNLPPGLPDQRPDRVLEAARAIVAKERGAKPRDLRETLLAARPAQEYDVDLPGPKPIQLRVKTLVIGHWIYELSVMGSKGDVAGKAASEFFDSFAVQPKAEPARDPNEEPGPLA